MTDHGEPRRSTIDPLMSGVDAVAAGYRTVEYVFDAFAESMRRRPGAGYEHRAPASQRYGRSSAGPRGTAARVSGTRTSSSGGGGRGDPGYGRGKKTGTAPLPPAGGLAHLVAEFLDLLGEAVREIEGIGDEIFGDDVPRLELHGFPDDNAELTFRFTNTGSSVLNGLDFEKTRLLGEFGGVVKAERIGFDLKPNTRVEPERSLPVKLTVKIPPDLGPGVYRGVIAATSTSTSDGADSARAHAEIVGVDAWALVELEVRALDPTYPITPEGNADS